MEIDQLQCLYQRHNIYPEEDMSVQPQYLSGPALRVPKIMQSLLLASSILNVKFNIVCVNDT
jgi:hypothetical protein